MKNRNFTIVIKIDPTKIRAGHRSHISGTGVHQDKRTKRNRTRSQQVRREIREINGYA